MLHGWYTVQYNGLNTVSNWGMEWWTWQKKEKTGEVANVTTVYKFHCYTFEKYAT